MSILKGAGKFVYFWEIKHPQYCTLPIGQFMESPKICVPQFFNTEWYLKLYPRGKNETSPENTLCVIHRGQDSGPDTISINYEICLSTGKQICSSSHAFQKDSSTDYYTVLPHSPDSYDDPIVIILNMHCTSKECCSSSKRDLPFPIKLYARSKILYETKSFQRFIDSLINDTCTTITIPLISQENCPPLIMDLTNNSGDIIDLKVGLMGGVLKESLIVVCKIGVANELGQLLYSFEEKHTFVAGQEETWSLTKKIIKSHFKTYLSDSSSNKISLKADVAFSVGETRSEIVKVERIKASRNSIPGYEDVLANEMFRLYEENKLCDFSLRVGNETFHVHKVVLGAASPVFAAMFSNEMSEMKDSMVDIVDLDPETVKSMVAFMYTGSVKVSEYGSAKKLFIAADKYGISSLSDFIRNVMISCINCDSICDILLISDTYRDKKLEKEVLNFFKSNKSYVLSSFKWEAFEKENPSLAVKSLRQVCLLNKRKKTK